MDNNSQHSSVHGKALSKDHFSRHLSSELQSKKKAITTALASPDKLPQDTPRIASLFKLIRRPLNQILLMASPENANWVAEHVFEILDDLMPLVLNVRHFADYLEFGESCVLELHDHLVSFVCAVIARLHPQINEPVYHYFEKLTIFYFAAMRESSVALGGFILLFWSIEKHFDSGLFRNLLRICQICSRPRLKSTLICIQSKTSLIAADSDFKFRRVPFDFRSPFEPPCPKSRIISQLRNLVAKPHNPVKSLFLGESYKQKLLLSRLHSGFEDDDLHPGADAGRENLREMFDLIDSFLEARFEAARDQESQLALFREMKLLLNLLLTNRPIAPADIAIKHYFGILDTLSAHPEDFDQGLVLLRVLGLAPHVLREDNLKTSFQAILEETLGECLECPRIRRNPIFIFEMLSLYVRLTKRQVVAQPSAQFKQVLSQHLRSTFAVLLAELASDSRTGIHYKSRHFARSKVEQSISQIMSRIETHSEPPPPAKPESADNAGLEEQLENLRGLLGRVDSVDRENLSKDFQSLISALKSKK